MSPTKTTKIALGASAAALSAAVAIPAFALAHSDGDASVTQGSARVVAGETSLPATTSTTTPETEAERVARTFAGLSPAEAFAFRAMFWTSEERLAFRYFVATPEEREAFKKFVTPPPPPPPVRVSGGRVATSGGGGGGGGFLACVRNRESRGQYGVVNGSSGAGGAYQFMPGTWNNVARHAGRPDLVGVHPSQASRADQDAMASALYGWQGAAPWGGGC